MENSSDTENDNMSEESSEELDLYVDENFMADQIASTVHKRQKTNEMIDINGKLNDIKQQINYLINTLNANPAVCESKYTSLSKEYVKYYQEISDLVMIDDMDPTKMTKLVETPLIQLLISEIDEKLVILEQMIHDHNEKKILRTLRNDYMKEFMPLINSSISKTDKKKDNDNSDNDSYFSYFS